MKSEQVERPAGEPPVHAHEASFEPGRLVRQFGQARTWKRLGEVLYQAGRDFVRDDGGYWAAAIAYYALFSIFPLLLATAAIAAYFVDPGWVIDQATRLIGQYLPRGAGEIARIVNEVIAQRGGIGIIALIGLLWAGTRVFGTITKALNIAYDVDEYYGFLRRTLTEFAMLGTVGVLFLLALATRPLLALLTSVTGGTTENPGWVTTVVSAMVPSLILLIAFYLLYRYLPRRRITGTAALAGGLVATIIFSIILPLFSFYLRNFSQYDLIYGSITAIIVVVLWAYITGMILLYGGEVASHVQFIVLDGMEPEEVEKRHLERNPTHPYRGEDLEQKEEAAERVGESRG